MLFTRYPKQRTQWQNLKEHSDLPLPSENSHLRSSCKGTLKQGYPRAASESDLPAVGSLLGLLLLPSCSSSGAIGTTGAPIQCSFVSPPQDSSWNSILEHLAQIFCQLYKQYILSTYREASRLPTLYLKSKLRPQKDKSRTISGRFRLHVQ